MFVSEAGPVSEGFVAVSFAKAIDIIRRELDTTMAFCGRTNVLVVGRDILQIDDATWRSIDRRRFEVASAAV